MNDDILETINEIVREGQVIVAGSQLSESTILGSDRVIMYPGISSGNFFVRVIARSIASDMVRMKRPAEFHWCILIIPLLSFDMEDDN